MFSSDMKKYQIKDQYNIQQQIFISNSDEQKFDVFLHNSCLGICVLCCSLELRERCRSCNIFWLQVIEMLNMYLYKSEIELEKLSVIAYSDYTQMIKNPYLHTVIIVHVWLFFFLFVLLCFVIFWFVFSPSFFEGRGVSKTQQLSII